ncbi:hypothetical protein DPMN_118187 [Dreissena polymorpha]|uniref:Uncharacterized protein n=1 Tax=Dreissena polymorpha TaxID=45954 RepID=A0A9D4JQV5_DREPO|nr:hypothetical protein DPMN_118187 [Dreissena polymorpha]
MTPYKRRLNDDINMNGEKLEEVTSFMYLGATLSRYCTSTTEVRLRMTRATEAMVRLSRLWSSSSPSPCSTRPSLYPS